jgi:sulfide dehydrogenase cytochrome subunit
MNLVLPIFVMLLCLLLPHSLIADEHESAPLASLAIQGCFGCHGPKGQSGTPAIPSLAGLPRDYLLQVLRAYRHGGRFGTVMGRLLSGAGDADLREMADYFSRQTFRVPKQRVDWDLASKGRQLHRLYCRECHGDRNREAEPGTPKLNGQWMGYLRWTLRDYLVGSNQIEEEMSQSLIRIIRRHGEDGLEALVHYYGSARPTPMVTQSSGKIATSRDTH